MNDVAPTLDTPAVHPTYLRLLCQTLRSHGVDPDPVLQAVGLGSWAELSSRDALVTQRAVNALITECLRATGRPWLGLELGMVVPSSAHGPMGVAAAASRNLRQALDALSRYLPTRNAALRMRLRDTPQGVALELIERVELGEARTFVVSMVLAALMRLIEAVLGRLPDTLTVDLPFPEPAWRAQLDRLHTGRVRFDRPRLVVHVDHALLAQPCMSADPGAFEQACQACERLLAASAEAGLVPRVRELLLGREGSYPTLAQTARYFNLSPRTLIRRLKAEGSAYQQLLDAARQQRAQWYLSHTPLTIEEIAARLGYADTSNFSRTYRRWFGVTPSQARGYVPSFRSDQAGQSP
jgi:AraC-like DNA-binding protein